jgi:hypothetical protein
MKSLQPMLIKSYKDEFDTQDNDSPPRTPGEVLQKGDPKDEVSDEEQFKYRSGVGKLLHMMKWTRPEILNAVRELSRVMSEATKAHIKAMYRLMKYCIATPNRGILLTAKHEVGWKQRFRICGQWTI